jgi:CheY-like chemotaxis protein
MCVMVVDDDPFVRESIKEILEDEGYDVITATDGADGLRVLRMLPNAPCVVVLDLMMPIMSGEEMLKALKTVHAFAAIPVTIVTASGAPKPDEAAGLLRKPLDLDSLLRVVAKSCGPHA